MTDPSQRPTVKVPRVAASQGEPTPDETPTQPPPRTNLVARAQGRREPRPEAVVEEVVADTTDPRREEE